MHAIGYLALQGSAIRALTVPGLLVAAYVLLDGICAIVAGVKIHSTSKRGLLVIADGVFRSVLSLLFVLLALAGGGLFQAFVLALIITGIIEIAAAIRLRNYLTRSILFGVGGAISILLFLFMIAIFALTQPRKVQVVLMIVTGGFLMVYGALTLWFGLTMRASTPSGS